MNESVSSSGAQVIAASLTTATMALLGVPYLALVWAFLGAFGGLLITPQESRKQAVVTIVLSGFLGAALGYACARWVAADNIALQNAACAICGAGAKPLLALGVEALKSQFSKWGQK